MNDRLSALLILLSAAASLASAKLRPFGEAGSEEYSMPPRLTRQPLAPTQYFLHKGRFGKYGKLEENQFYRVKMIQFEYPMVRNL